MSTKNARFILVCLITMISLIIFSAPSFAYVRIMLEAKNLWGTQFRDISITEGYISTVVLRPSGEVLDPPYERNFATNPITGGISPVRLIECSGTYGLHDRKLVEINWDFVVHIPGVGNVRRTGHQDYRPDGYMTNNTELYISRLRIDDNRWRLPSLLLNPVNCY